MAATSTWEWAWATVRLLAGVCTVLALLWTSHVTARRILLSGQSDISDTSRSTQWVATLVVFGWLTSLSFYVLAGIASWFRPGVVVVFSAVITSMSHRAWGAGAWSELITSVRDARRCVWDRLSRIESGVLVIAALLMAARALRGLVMPPLGQDSLSYHLVRAARWARSGAWTYEQLPDVGRFLDAYPVGGDLPWAWAMVVPGSDALVGLSSAASWGACVLTAYAAARRLDAPVERAVLAAAATSMIPAVASLATSAYVDLQMLCWVLASVVFVASPKPTFSFFAGAALGLACGVKVSAAPLIVLALVVTGWRAVRERDLRGALLRVGYFVVGLLIILPSLYRTWRATGNPVYPFAISILGIHFPGNELFDLIVSAELFGRPTWSPTSFFRLLFLPGLWHGRDETGLGPTPLLLFGFAAFGAVSAWRAHANRRSVIGYLIFVVLITVAPIFSAQALAYRTGFAIHTGRFLLPAAAAVVLLAAASPGLWARRVVTGALAINIVLSIPHGWSTLDAGAFGALALYALGAVAIAVVGVVVARKTARPRIAAGVITAAVCLALILAQLPRQALRYSYYECASLGKCFDLHVTIRQQTAAWPIWQELDDNNGGEGHGQGHRIAAFSGWDGFGGFPSRYPLFGRRLQNEVMYVSPAKNGEVIDYRLYDPAAKAVAMRAWVRALLHHDIDVVVALVPASFEFGWIKNHPEIFHPWVASADGASHAYKLDRTEAQAWLVAIEQQPPPPQ